MLKRMIYRKICVGTSLLIIILLMYIIPLDKKKIEYRIDYIDKYNLEDVYLLNDEDYLVIKKVNVDGDIENKVLELIEWLKIDGKKKDIIPIGYKNIIPKGVNVLNIDINDGILKIDFSKEILDISKKYEEKMIEGITYTLTSIDKIDKIDIYVEGKKLDRLPYSRKLLPFYLDKNYGINKEYEITMMNDIDSYTIYYMMNYNNEDVLIPVTKYINNNNQDKVRIIIEEMSSGFNYDMNLSSYLDRNIKLLDYELLEDTIKLNFNEYILSDIINGNILEEVRYTIGYSMCDEFMINKVIFMVNDKEITTFLLKSIEK